jgi:hypothetical protein
MRLIKDPWNTIVLVAVSMLIFMFVLTRQKIKGYKVDPPPRKIDRPVDSTFTPQKLVIYLRDVGIKHAEIVYAQAVLETGNFKSKSFRLCNNLFGMKVARSRPTTALGERYGHAYFKDWRMSVIDYAMFQSAYTRKIRTKEGYYEYLSRNYASDVEYVNKLKNIIAKL